MPQAKKNYNIVLYEMHTISMSIILNLLQMIVNFSLRSSPMCFVTDFREMFKL